MNKSDATKIAAEAKGLFRYMTVEQAGLLTDKLESRADSVDAVTRAMRTVASRPDADALTVGQIVAGIDRELSSNDTPTDYMRQYQRDREEQINRNEQIESGRRIIAGMNGVELRHAAERYLAWLGEAAGVYVRRPLDPQTSVPFTLWLLADQGVMA